MIETILNSLFYVIWWILEPVIEFFFGGVISAVISTLGTALISGVIGYLVKRKGDQLVTLSSLLSEIEENRERSTDIVVNVCHDIQSRTSIDSRYTWSTREFSTAAYDQLRIQSIDDKIPSDLVEKLNVHYDELQENNQALRERESELLEEEAVSLDQTINGRDGGIVCGILMICTREHAEEILQSENRDGVKLSNDQRIHDIFNFAYSMESQMEKLSTVMESGATTQSLEQIINHDPVWEFQKKKTINSEYEKYARLKEFRGEYNFDTVKNAVEKEINSYNFILRKLFL